MTRGMDVDYLLQREGEEWALAEACDDAAVRAVHLELAERYADAARRWHGIGGSLRIDGKPLSTKSTAA